MDGPWGHCAQWNIRHRNTSTMWSHLNVEYKKNNSQKQQICGCQRLEAGFPDTSVGKESACNAGDPSLIPGSERSAGEGIGYPLQYSWASFVAQLVKLIKLPVMLETWVRSLGEIPGWVRYPGEGKGHSLQYPGLENSMGCMVHGVTKSRTRLSDFHSQPLTATLHLLSIPLALGSQSSTLCLRRFAYSGCFISKESYNMWSFVMSFFHLCFQVSSML